MRSKRKTPSIRGVTLNQTDDYMIATITELSDELKTVIRDRFSAICHGEQNSLLNRGSYTYGRTIEEFLTRVRSKDTNTQTGMLGELVVHVLTVIMYPNYRTIVPYFNLEERNVKKGFDSIIYSPDFGIRVCEVKSSKTSPSSVDSKIKSLLKTAHDDLSKKLEKQDDTIRLWTSAMNGFRAACSHLKDEKKVLENIIADHQDQAWADNCSPKHHDVILSSVLITEKDGEITTQSLVEKHGEYKDSYNTLMVVAVRKSLAIDLLNFFSEEMTNEVP